MKHVAKKEQEKFSVHKMKSSSAGGLNLGYLSPREWKTVSEGTQFIALRQFPLTKYSIWVCQKFQGGKQMKQVENPPAQLVSGELGGSVEQPLYVRWFQRCDL